MSKSNAVSNFDKSLREEKVIDGPQNGKGAVMFNDGSSKERGERNNDRNGERNNGRQDRNAERGNGKRNGNGGNDGDFYIESMREPDFDRGHGGPVTLKRNLPEAKENDNKLLAMRESIGKSTADYVNAIDEKIAELEEEVKVLKNEKSYIMHLAEMIRVY